MLLLCQSATVNNQGRTIMTLHLYTKLDDHGKCTNAQYDKWLASVRRRELKSACLTALAMAVVTGIMVYTMLISLPL